MMLSVRVERSEGGEDADEKAQLIVKMMFSERMVSGGGMEDCRMKTSVSKFMSYILRHDPQGLQMDEDGFVDMQAFVEKLRERYPWIDRVFVEDIVREDRKGRYEIRGDRIRARYGHSINVSPHLPPASDVQTLYHGTTAESAERICREGLKPMDRRKVHLASTIEWAVEVAMRRTMRPVILAIDVKRAIEHGIRIEKATERVYVADEIPPYLISVLEISDEKMRALKKRIIRNDVWTRMHEYGLTQRRLADNERGTIGIPTFNGQERAAERLRGLPEYKSAVRVFVPPDAVLFQVRFNCVRDGKTVVMATPALKDGFYEIDRSIDAWRLAIRTHGVYSHGRRLHTSLSSIGRIDMMVTGAVAVSINGERIGKGTAFFDIEYQILREIGAVDEHTPIAAIVHDVQVYEKEMHTESRWDVPVDIIVTPSRVIRVPSAYKRKPSGIDKAYAMRIMNRMRSLREIIKMR